MKGAMITVGADPEFFIGNARGRPVPICGLLGGTKDKPYREPRWPRGYAVQEDNVMAEYNVPAATDSMAFAESIQTGRQFVMETLFAAGHTRYQALSGCAFEFDGMELMTPQAKMFGCSADFDGHEMGVPLARIVPDVLRTASGEWRFAGGHVHVGYRKAFTFEMPEFVGASMCDLFLSLPLIAQMRDVQGERRKFYGTPGRYRPTPYGLEYRTLGNGWTFSSRYAHDVADRVFRTFGILARNEDMVRRIYNEMPWVAVREAINSEDVGMAADLHARASTFLKAGE